jgi:uncharacterized protein (DUF2147 family)
MMKRLFALAAFLLASTAAQAQYTFDYGGRTIRIDPDRGTVSIPGVYDNTGRRKHAHGDRDSDRPRKQAPEQAKVEPLAPVQPDAAPSTAVAPTTTTPDPSTNTANVAPADIATSPPPPANTPATVPAQDIAPAVAPPAPAPAVVAAPPPPPPPAPAQKQAAAAPTSTAQPATTPLGLWLTEEKEGQVRIEQCGANLCGYSVDKKSNQNGEQVLINMKPAKDSKWSGRILDPNTGSTYDSTIAMKGSDTLRVQGCAFGGMFCGGQTWSRVN